MPNLPTKLLLFMSSYSFVYAIFGLRALPHRSAIVFFAAFFLGIGFFAIFFISALKKAPIEVEIKEVAPRDPELAAYAATYLLPFVLTPTGRWQDWAALGVFFFVIGLLYVNSSMLYLNPLLALARLHLWEVRIGFDGGAANMSPPRFLVSSRERLQPGDRLKVAEFARFGLIET